MARIGAPAYLRGMEDKFGQRPPPLREPWAGKPLEVLLWAGITVGWVWLGLSGPITDPSWFRWLPLTAAIGAALKTALVAWRVYAKRS
jgi:hypothetical protein